MTTSRYLALLRGINVGGKNILPMKALAALFTAAGCSDVETYIQSGNVVFTAPAKVAKGIDSVLTRRIEEDLGLRIPLVIRSAAELSEAIDANPFLEPGVAEDALHVYFLASHPSPEKAAQLDPDRAPPDRFVLRNREVYLHLPNGMGRTKLTNAYFDAKLATVSTARNWRTVLKLDAMLNKTPRDTPLLKPPAK